MQGLQEKFTNRRLSHREQKNGKARYTMPRVWNKISGRVGKTQPRETQFHSQKELLCSKVGDDRRLWRNVCLLRGEPIRISLDRSCARQRITPKTRGDRKGTSQWLSVL